MIMLDTSEAFLLRCKAEMPRMRVDPSGIAFMAQ
jgi:hypothetical protein